MDKDFLYYIVMEGSNERIITVLKEPWIGTKEAAEKKVKLIKKNNSLECQALSINEFEETFTEDNSGIVSLEPLPKYKGSIAP